MKRARCLAVCFLAAACSKPAPPEPAPKSRLEEAVAGLHATAPCSRAIPLHWSSSWPVPAREGGAPVYRLFFYGRDGRPPEFAYHQAEGDAVFRADGTVLSCVQRAEHAGTVASDNARYAGMTLDQIVERERILYLMIEDAAGLYAAGKPLTPEEKKRVAGFSAAFAFLSHAGHAAAYRALNPDFWSWVEKNGGAAPAAP
jgi:hypothetical protein